MFEQGILPDDAVETFLLKRQIVLAEMITGDTHDLLSSHILYLNAKSYEPITLIVHSEGGSCCATDHICDAIRRSVAPVHGLVIGEAGSGAFLVLQACHRRLAYPNAHLLFHSPDLGGVRVDLPNLRGEIAKALLAHRRNLHMVARRCKQSVATVAEWSRTEYSFTAIEALKHGIIDEIVQPTNGK